jgi:hypothetical protein
MKKVNLTINVLRNTAFIAFTITTIFFTSCQKENAEMPETKIEQVSTENQPNAYTVSSIHESEMPDYLTVLFQESASIFIISKNATAQIALLKASQTQQTPVTIDIREGDYRTIESVKNASIATINEYKEIRQSAIAFKALDMERQSALDTRANDVIPDMNTLNQLFQKLQSASVVNSNGYVINSGTNFYNYYLGRIPFQYVTDGCYARAHAMRKIVEETFGYTTYKRFIWVKPNASATLNVKAQLWGNRNGCCVRWRYHVAPMVKVKTSNGTIQLYVLDPSIFTTPVPASTWDNSMIGNTSTVCQPQLGSNFQVYSTYSNYYSPIFNTDGSVSQITQDNNYTQTAQTLYNYRLKMGCN